MKYCPNPECPHYISTGSPAEFLEEIQVCSDCGTRLEWGEASEVIIPEPEPDVVVPWAVVATFNSGLEATVAKGRLEAEGIEVMFLDEQNANTKFLCSCGYGEIKLAVLELDAPTAREILNADYSRAVTGNISGPTGNT